MEDIYPEERSGALSKTFEVEHLAPSILGLQCNIRSSDLPRYGKIGACQGHSAGGFVPSIFCLIRWDCFPLSQWEWDCCSKEFRKGMTTIVVRRSISRRQDSSRGLGIGVESHERHGSQKKYFSKNKKCWSSGLARFRWCILGRFVHSSILSRSTNWRAGLCSRKTPMKQQSIPRLELQAAMHRTRLEQLIVDEHDGGNERTFFWTDSTTVLQWLQGADKKQAEFVANRVAETLDSSTIDQWERMVRSCKKPMMAIVGNRTLTDDVLSTTMCLVEQILNSRPATSVSNDPEDLEALTPNHFLLGRASPETPIIPDTQRYTDLQRVFRVSQANADMIRSRLNREYLPHWNEKWKWNIEEVFADASLDSLCIVAYFRDQQTGELAYVVGKRQWSNNQFPD